MSKYIPGSENISNINKQVGIGTLNPTETLDVVGNINCSGQILQNNQPFVPTIIQAGTNYGDYLYWNGTGAYVVGDNRIKLGANAGETSQGTGSVAIGPNSASISQGDNSIAIGPSAGQNTQEIGSIAIGYQAGQTNQGTGGGYAVAVGYLSGYLNQGLAAISIGIQSGFENQQDNCIAIGTNAGQIDQGITADPIEGQAIAIGYKAAQFQQGDKAISIGDHSGQNQQHDQSIAIGSYAGNLQQSTGSIAIGINAGYNNQGEYSIAIGTNAGYLNQPSHSIVLNATGTELNPSTEGFFVNPVRTAIPTDPANMLLYNSDYEIFSDFNFSYQPALTGYIISGNLIPSANAVYDLGSINTPWKSIYVSTGSVFLGPTGALEINSNGLIASIAGFAAPFYQVGSTNPGEGIDLYVFNDKLYFINQFGASGPVSIFNVASNSINNISFTGGNLGIGTDNPDYPLDVIGTISAISFTGSSAYLTNINTSSIESQNSTLNIATETGITNIINIGTSNSIQTVNIGTVGLGQTTINLGGVGDTVNVAGDLVYVNSRVTEITNPYFIINQGNPNINNSGIIVSKTGLSGESTGAYLLVNSSSNGWITQAGDGQIVNLNQDVGTGSNPSFTTLNTTTLNTNTLNSSTINTSSITGSTSTFATLNAQNISCTSLTGSHCYFTGVHASDKVYIGKTNVGTIAFEKSGQTGCFISGLKNSTGSNYVNYNSTTNELVYNQASYLYAYDTTTQNPLSTAYTGVNFNTVNQNVGWTHTSGTSLFSATFSTSGIYLVTYSLQVHANANPNQTLSAYLELDGSPIAGSARSATVATNTSEYAITQQVLVSMSSGSHTLQIMMQGTNANISIQPATQIAAPGSSGSGATLTIYKVV